MTIGVSQRLDALSLSFNLASEELGVGPISGNYVQVEKVKGQKVKGHCRGVSSKISLNK